MLIELKIKFDSQHFGFLIPSYSSKKEEITVSWSVFTVSLKWEKNKTGFAAVVKSD